MIERMNLAFPSKTLKDKVILNNIIKLQNVNLKYSLGLIKLHDIRTDLQLRPFGAWRLINKLLRGSKVTW